MTSEAEAMRERRRELLRRRIAESGAGSAPVEPPAIRAGERYPLSHGQRRMWFLQTLDPDDPTLNICVGYRLTGALDRERLRRSLNEVVARHTVLRTTYGVDGDGEPYQRFREDAAVPWEAQDLSGLAGPDRQRRIETLARTEFARPFDLARDLPLRVTLIATGAGEFVLLLVVHHICWDDDCWNIFFAEWSAAYSGDLPSRPAEQYLAAAVLAGPAGPVQADVEYWRNTLLGLAGPPQLPGPSATRPSRRADRLTRALPEGLAERVENFAREHCATPFMVLLAGFGVLIRRYTGSSDFLVAVPTTERGATARDAIGYFGNTLLLRITVGSDDTFGSLVEAVRQTCLAGFAHQSVGVDRVVRAANPDRADGHDGLDQLVRLGFSMRRDAGGMAFDGVSARGFGLGATTAPLPLALAVVRAGAAVLTEFEYQTDALADTLVDQMLTHYLQLLDSALGDPADPVIGLDLLDAGQRAAILAQSHGELVEEPATTVVALLESTASGATAGSDAVALVSDDTELTYAELHRRANRLARWLIGNRIGTEDVVGIKLAGSVEFVVAVLAVWKSGAAYLPIDPAYPQDRIDYLIADTAPAMVIGRDEFAAAETAAARLPDAAPGDTERIRPLRPQNLAYVIYTSGSTGRPKGVAVAHEAIAEHLVSFLAEWGMTAEDRLLLSSSVSFDASVADIFLTLCLGATLVVPQPSEAGAAGDVEYLAGVIDRHGVTVLHTVPSMLGTLLLSQAGRSAQWRRLRHLPVGGEVLPGRVADQFVERFDAELRNHYGPTEAVVCSTHQPVRRESGGAGNGPVPIGVPNRNVYAYVLDSRLQPVPAEVIGELYLGGAQLARGYPGRPGLTAQRFIADPFHPGMRLYRSGDLVRRNLTGELEFIGRADQQVKIRGFRVELGEVESVIASHPAVRDCRVVAENAEHGAMLAAYLVPAPNQPDRLDFNEIREHAAALLPDYMLPGAFAVIPDIPLTVSGKLDRAALPAPVPAGAAGYREPGTATERRICAIFAGLFNCERVGATDSFFALGGHSLLAARLIATLRAEFGVDLTVRTVFDCPTPAGLADRLVQRFRAEFDIDLDADLDPAAADEPADGAPTPQSPQRPPLVFPVAGERIPLSYSQLVAWFQHRLEGARPEFNMPLALEFNGPLEIAHLAAAIDDVVARHDALRMNFAEHDGVPCQFIAPSPRVELPVRPVAADGVHQAIAELRDQVLTPETGPLIRASLLTVDAATHVLLVIIHHIVSDHASLGIILDDLVVAYRARLAGEPPGRALPAPGAARFADYARWQRNTFDTPGEWAQGELAYWRDTLAGLPEQVSVAADRQRPAVLGKRGEAAHFIVPAAQRTALVRLGEQHGATEFMVYQGAVAALLHKLGGGTDIALGSPAAARVDPASAGLVGLLANAVVLRNDLSGDPSPRDLVSSSRETVLGAFAHQEAPIERLVELLNPTRSRSWNPLYQTMIHFHAADWAATPRDLTGTGETSVAVLPAVFDVALLDLDLGVTVTPRGELDVRVVGNADLYRPQTVGLIATAFREMLVAFATTPDRPMSALRLLFEADSARADSAGLAAAPNPVPRELDPAQPDPAQRGSVATERTLIALLEELLDISGAEPDDNFFALGGDSIISIKWSARAVEAGLALTPAMVFEHMTIGELAAAVDSTGDPVTGQPEAEQRSAPMSASGLDTDALTRLTAAWSRQR